MARPWDDLLSDQDRAVIDEAGYAEHGASTWNSRELGSRFALVVIDMQRFIVGDNVPILEAVKSERVAMGEIAWRGMESIQSMLQACREASLPIMFTRVLPKNRDPKEPDLQIVDPLTPRKDELVFDKRASSAFFGTTLEQHLQNHRVDTLVLVGTSTSGCVRATAVDARAHGYGVLIPEECVFDRIEASHKIGLLDLWMKYATVEPLSEVKRLIASQTLAEAST